LKRHRDRLMRDQQELSRELAETRAELHGTQLKAAEAQVRYLWATAVLGLLQFACVTGMLCGTHMVCLWLEHCLPAHK
jgi:hypothetical protein